MTRLAASAVVVLLLLDPIRADMGPPWPTHRVPVRVTITADPPPAGVELFIEAGGVRRMPTDSPLVLKSDRQTGGVGFHIYAVQTVALKRFEGGIPPRAWFRFDNPDCTSLGRERVRGDLDFFDGRTAVVQEYRLERVSDWMLLRKVADNTGSRWWFTWPCCAATFALPLGIAWLGVWLVRRVWRAGRPAA